jgi:simple sugar transport system ATP-binding protein
VARLLTVVEELRVRKVSVLFVSHRLDEVIKIAERITVLRDGHKIGTWPAREIDRKKLTIAMTGRVLVATPPAPVPKMAGTVLLVDHLTRHGEYDHVSFSLRSGEILGIGGLLGSGRTELALTLFGMAPPDTGSIQIDGHPVHMKSNRDAIRHGIAYVSEDRLRLGLVIDQPISENLLLGAMRPLTGWFGLINIRRFQTQVDQWISSLGIKTGDSSLPVTALSGGNQQRVAIGKWLARAPKICILDSPTVGVDVGAREGLYAIIRRIAQTGTAVIVISDEVEELHGQCHRVLVMRSGKITSELYPDRDAESALEAAIHA